MRAACASNFENGSFHPQKSAFSNHRDIWRRHISPRFEACRKRQRALPPYRLTLRFTHCPARSRFRLPRRRIPQTRTRRLVARVFFEETSNVIKTIYPFILSLNCNIKYHYAAMPERQRPLRRPLPLGGVSQRCTASYRHGRHMAAPSRRARIITSLPHMLLIGGAIQEFCQLS